MINELALVALTVDLPDYMLVGCGSSTISTPSGQRRALRHSTAQKIERKGERL